MVSFNFETMEVFLVIGLLLGLYDSRCLIWSLAEHLQSGEKSDENECTLIVMDNSGYPMNDESETEPINIIGQCSDSLTSGKRFDNSDVAYDFYNEYGLSRGFGIHKHQLYQSKVTKEIYKRIFVCNEEGHKDMNDKRRDRDNVKRRCIKRTGCNAMIQITMSKQGDWIVDKFDDGHNHFLDPPHMYLSNGITTLFIVQMNVEI